MTMPRGTYSPPGNVPARPVPAQAPQAPSAPLPPPAPMAPAAPVPPPGQAAAPGPGDPYADACPRCGQARLGPFCASCGFSFEPARGRARHAGPAAPAQVAWTAVVGADRSYYEAMVGPGGPEPGSPSFPGYGQEREYVLTAPRMRIGRRSSSLGLEPDIDLTGPPTDPGVSRLHAILVAEPDGSWAVLDSGSANGTLVNDREIVTGVRVPLRDGDRIHMGAWTVLTIQAR
jgi:FHA domain